MPQETNLNVAPYFDDFDPQSNYYKVLFKPAYPVQARELNNLQSILQNQIEDMGTHFFREGAKVIPGQLTYLPQFYAVQVEPELLHLLRIKSQKVVILHFISIITSQVHQIIQHKPSLTMKFF